MLVSLLVGGQFQDTLDASSAADVLLLSAHHIDWMKIVDCSTS